MTEGEKEKLKHRATFYNGIGLVVLAALSVGAAVRAGQRIDQTDTTLYYYVPYLKGAFFIGLGIAVARFMHAAGQRELDKIDESKSADDNKSSN